MTRQLDSDDLIARFESLSSSAISDALDRCGIAGQPLGIRPIERSFRCCGLAWTVSYKPVDPLVGGSVGDFIDDIPPGSVVVIDNGGRLDATVWGDLMTTVASRNGLAATVIDGVSRDTMKALELQYPIFARSTFMRTGKDRVTVEATQVPVHLSGLVVSPGDFVFGDVDGVVVVPHARAEEVCSSAFEIHEAEEGIRGALHDGSRLDAARESFSYHNLQRARPS
jgi:4-hydroxy-4-methyl-2-oxoglutarate aldolase